jgi:hypothetical protein
VATGIYGHLKGCARRLIAQCCTALFALKITTAE